MTVQHGLEPDTPHRRVLCVVGTRPEAIKVAPVVLALRAAGWHPVVATTGQHGAVVDEALEAFGIRPDVTGVPWSRGPALSSLHSELVGRLARDLEVHTPAAVLVQGDTASTLAGALAGFWARVPVVHLEAGLRSGSLSEPFPEEGNRRLVAQVSALHLAPTPAAHDALRREGIAADDILVVGNTVVDAVRLLSERVGPPPCPESEAARAPLVLVTCHRRENWNTGIVRVAAAVRRLVETHADIDVVVAAHPNPAVRAVLDDRLGGTDAVTVRDAVAYPEFVGLLARAAVVVTDSGGVQEEAAALGVPAVVLREVTERPEGVDAGLAELVGTDPASIVAAVSRVLAAPPRSAVSRPPCPYGDGQAARRCVEALGALLEGTARPDPFVPAVTTMVVATESP